MVTGWKQLLQRMWLVYLNLRWRIRYQMSPSSYSCVLSLQCPLPSPSCPGWTDWEVLTRVTCLPASSAGLSSRRGQLVCTCYSGPTPVMVHSLTPSSSSLTPQPTSLLVREIIQLHTSLSLNLFFHLHLVCHCSNVESLGWLTWIRIFFLLFSVKYRIMCLS